MKLTFFQGLVTGLVSGLAELLPISASAHRGFLRLCFGTESEGALFLLLCHIATLSVVIFSLRFELSRLNRARRIMGGSRRRRHQADPSAVSTLRHLRPAALIVAVARLFSRQTGFMADRLHLLCIALVFSGLLLWLPGVLRSGNKDGRNMLRLDSYLIGLAGALGVIPGFSLVGAAASVGTARGVERGYALRFSLMLLIPALAVDVVLDVLALAAAGALPGLIGILSALAGGVLCALGSWLGLRIMQAMARSVGFTGWCFYQWGMALVCFVLFLIL